MDGSTDRFVVGLHLELAVPGKVIAQSRPFVGGIFLSKEKGVCKAEPLFARFYYARFSSAFQPDF